MKLYRVTLKGLHALTSGQVNYQVSYVVADNAETAYKTVRAYMDEKDLGAVCEREMDKVELLAEAKDYTDTGHMLFMAKPTVFTYNPAWSLIAEGTPGVKINFPDLPPDAPRPQSVPPIGAQP